MFRAMPVSGDRSAKIPNCERAAGLLSPCRAAVPLLDGLKYRAAFILSQQVYLYFFSERKKPALGGFGVEQIERLKLARGAVRFRLALFSFFEGSRDVTNGGGRGVDVACKFLKGDADLRASPRKRFIGK